MRSKPRPPVVIDKNDEQLHRVPATDLLALKEGTREKVTAICGKTWTPTWPVNRMREISKCPVCFPNEHNRYGIAR